MRGEGLVGATLPCPSCDKAAWSGSSEHPLLLLLLGEVGPSVQSVGPLFLVPLGLPVTEMSRVAPLEVMQAYTCTVKWAVLGVVRDR